MKKNMKKNMYKNKLILNFLFKRQFSHFAKSQTPASLRNFILKKEFDKKNQIINNNSSEKDIIQKDIVDYIDAKKSIKSDLAKIEPAHKAVEKISNNETPLKKEFTAYSDLKNEYQEHLDEYSDSDNESESSSHKVVTLTKQNQHEKLNDLKTYLKSEYKSTSSSLKKLRKSFSKLPIEEEKKRKMEESSDLDSSKRSRQSVQDFIDDLPTDYNPLDDIE